MTRVTDDPSDLGFSAIGNDWYTAIAGGTCDTVSRRWRHIELSKTAMLTD
jgi:hypothetical protein